MKLLSQTPKCIDIHRIFIRPTGLGWPQKHLQSCRNRWTKEQNLVSWQSEHIVKFEKSWKLSKPIILASFATSSGCNVKLKCMRQKEGAICSPLGWKSLSGHHSNVRFLSSQVSNIFKVQKNCRIWKRFAKF